MGLGELTQTEALGSLGHTTGLTFDNVSHHTVRFLHDGLNGRRHRNGAPPFLHRLNAFGDSLGAQKGTHAIMNEHGRVLIAIKEQGIDPVANGLLTRCAARYHIDHLSDIVMNELLAQERNPIFKADHNDGIDIRVILEDLDGVNDDGFTVKLEELLRSRLRVHALACSPSKYQCAIHG